MEILAERKQVVSSLGPPMSDADFIKEYGTKARNLGFHSLASTAAPTMRNTLKVVGDGHIIAVKLSAYDTDGQEGVYIPGSEDINALKEVGANIGGSMGTSFTFASSAKDQIISEAARGVMQGASQLLQKKLRTIKVTLKGGYRLFLVQSK